MAPGRSSRIDAQAREARAEQKRSIKAERQRDEEAPCSFAAKKMHFRKEYAFSQRHALFP